MKCAARMHTHDRPEWMRTLEEIRVWIERQIQAVPSILGEARRERSKTERAKTEQAQKLQPSPPPLSLSFSLSLSRFRMLDWHSSGIASGNVVSLTSFDNLHDDVGRRTMRSLEVRRQHRRFLAATSTSVAKFTNSSRALARAGTWTVSLRGHSARGTLTVTSGDGAGVSSHAD